MSATRCKGETVLRFAQVKGEPAKRVQDTEQNAAASRRSGGH